MPDSRYLINKDLQKCRSFFIDWSALMECPFSFRKYSKSISTICFTISRLLLRNNSIISRIRNCSQTEKMIHNCSQILLTNIQQLNQNSMKYSSINYSRSVCYAINHFLKKKRIIKILFCGGHQKIPLNTTHLSYEISLF